MRCFVMFVNAVHLLSRLFTASLFTHAKEKVSPHSVPSQVFRFALAFSSLAILSALSTIE